MPASITDKVSKVSSGVRPVSTTVSTIRNSGATTLASADLTGWTTTEVVFFVTYKINGSGAVIVGSQSDWKGIVSGSNINNLVLTGGADAGNAAGDIVEMLPTAEYAKQLAEHSLAHTDQDGSLKAGSVDNAAVLATDVVETAKIKDLNITTAKIAEGSITPSKRSGGFKTGLISSTLLGTTGPKSITGLTFQPKFLRIYVGFDVTAAGAARECIGVSDGTSVFVRGTAVSGSSQSRWSIPSVLINIRTEADASVLVANFTSFNSDGFTFNVTTADAAYSGYYEVYA